MAKSTAILIPQQLKKYFCAPSYYGLASVKESHSMQARNRTKMKAKFFHHDCQSSNTSKEQNPLVYSRYLVSLSLPETELYTYSARLLDIVQHVSLFRASTNIWPAHLLSDFLQPTQYKQYSASQLGRTSPSQEIVDNRLPCSLRKFPPQSM